MQSNVLSDSQYFNMFKRPDISTYDFFRMFFAQLILSRSYSFPKEIAAEIYKLKNTRKFDNLLKEITFKNNKVFVYSNEVEDAINEFQTLGVLNKSTTTDENFYINMDEGCAKHMLGEYKQVFQNMIKQFTDDFLKGLSTKEDD